MAELPSEYHRLEGSARSPIPGATRTGPNFGEELWNDNGASGGGVSVNFPVPAWQISAVIPPDVGDVHHGRGSPDVAGYADPDVFGYELIQNGGTETPPPAVYLMLSDAGAAPSPASGSSQRPTPLTRCSLLH